MTMMSALVGRRRPRDSEADVETQIYVRNQPMAWDRVMVLQIMKGLETRLPRVVPPPMRPETPPSMRIVTPPSMRAASSRVVMTRRPVSVVRPADEPNVFLTPWTPADPLPPWAPAPAAPAPAAPAPAAPAPAAPAPAAAVEAAAVDETLVLEGRAPKRKVVVHKTKVPWLLFVMAFGIAFGVGQDRQLRRDLGSKLRVTTTQAAAAVARHVLLAP